MSQDFQLAFECPHLIIEEPVVLGADRRSLRTRSPVASGNIVRVLANDEAYIPSSGLHSQAQLVGTVTGPFRIPRCDRTLTVMASTESATVELPAGARVEAPTVARILHGALESVAVEVIQGRLVLTDTGRMGQESRLRVSGYAVAHLGFGEQRGARGQRVYPGWDLLSQQDVISTKFPRFREPLRGNPTLKVTYATAPSRCLRCKGTYIENDIRFNIQGEPLMVRDENLLYQAALKILLTRIRSNPYHPNYGSHIVSRVGAKAIGATASLLSEDVQNALATMQTIQQAQARYQEVSLRERLYSVTAVRVYPHEHDPTAFRVDVVVSNAAGVPVALTIVFSVPGVVALAGSNGLSLGLETTGLTAEQSARLFR